MCGSSFAKDCGIIRNDEFSRQTDIRAANGSSMQHLGVRTVRMQTVCDHQNLQVTFQVLNVERPLISVGKLAKDGCEINFDGTGGFIHHRGEVCVLSVWETCLGFESVCWETLEVAILSLELTILSCPLLMSRVDCLRQQVQVSIPCQVLIKKCPHWRVVKQSLHRFVVP